jgi:hypothetical protein
MDMALKLNVPLASSGMILRFMFLPFLLGLKIGRIAKDQARRETLRGPVTIKMTWKAAGSKI